jgi:hypothetical protein
LTERTTTTGEQQDLHRGGASAQLLFTLLLLFSRQYLAYGPLQLDRLLGCYWAQQQPFCIGYVVEFFFVAAKQPPENRGCSLEYSRVIRWDVGHP